MGFCEALEPKEEPWEDRDRTEVAVEGFLIFNWGGAVEDRMERVMVPAPSELLVLSELILKGLHIVS